MSGVFYIESGKQFNGDAVRAYPLGSTKLPPGNPIDRPDEPMTAAANSRQFRTANR